MKKTILTLVLVLTAFTALAAVSTPTAQGSLNTGNDVKSRIYYFVHTYGYRTYYSAPVVYYPRVYVAPVYYGYPVYTYHYWYYKYANWKK
jgi:hypothetical protein